MIKQGDRVVDDLSGRGVGTVTATSGGGPVGDASEAPVTVRFDGSDADCECLPDQLKLGGQVFVDARGAEMEPMTYLEALAVVSELAEDNTLGESQALDDDLEDERARQIKALVQCEEFTVRHADAIGSLVVPVDAGEFPDSTWRASPGLEPDDSISALRIALELARGGMVPFADTQSDPDLADAYDRQSQAIEIVTDLLGRHGDVIASLDAPSPRI